MQKAYSYIRFSRPEQIRGDSLRRQKENAEKWAAAKGVVIDETLSDLGVSGYRGKNRLVGNLGKFLALVKEGKVPKGSFLIVESLDRISRESVMEVLPRFLDLVNAGVTVVTLTDGQEYSKEKLGKNAMPLIMSLVIMSRANEESRTKAGRVGEAWQKKRDNASKAVVSARVPAWLTVVGEDRARRIEPIPERAEIVRRIFAESAAGLGRRRIAVGLNTSEPRIPTFGSGEHWQPSYIKKILENRATIGEYQPTVLKNEKRQAAGAPVVGYYPVIVSEPEFLRANAAKLRRTGTQGRPSSDGGGGGTILRGLAVCGACGGRMSLGRDLIKP